MFESPPPSDTYGTPGLGDPADNELGVGPGFEHGAVTVQGAIALLDDRLVGHSGGVCIHVRLRA